SITIQFSKINRLQDNLSFPQRLARCILYPVGCQGLKNFFLAFFLPLQPACNTVLEESFNRLNEPCQPRKNNPITAYRNTINLERREARLITRQLF
ncbi:MAG: hypothetical protein JW775_01475, partial [Candidatus Aminicenantes bacterium]|nr:hypothetical protein [Candidatus Aminicenantes bacterium]